MKWLINLVPTAYQVSGRQIYLASGRLPTTRQVGNIALDSRATPQRWRLDKTSPNFV